MSLIADALKKADTGSGAFQDVPPASPKSIWVYRVALLGSIGIVLIGLAWVARRPAPAAARTPVAAAGAEAQPAKNTGAQLLRRAQGGLAFNGTLLGGNGEALALIDNQVVQKGDRIRGMKVVQVNPDSVQLEDPSGNTKTLNLGN